MKNDLSEDLFSVTNFLADSELCITTSMELKVLALIYFARLTGAFTRIRPPRLSSVTVSTSILHLFKAVRWAPFQPYISVQPLRSAYLPRKQQRHLNPRIHLHLYINVVTDLQFRRSDPLCMFVSYFIRMKISLHTLNFKSLRFVPLALFLFRRDVLKQCEELGI